MAYSKMCKYCHVVTLEGYNEIENKYYEKGTKQLHTRERCAEAKNQDGAGLTPHHSPTPTFNQQQQQYQQQKTLDIKAAQAERKKEHDELIIELRNLRKAIVADIADRRDAKAQDVIDSIGFEEYRQDQREFMDEVV